MRLDLSILNIKEVQFAEKTAVSNQVLYVNIAADYAKNFYFRVQVGYPHELASSSLPCLWHRSLMLQT